MIRNRSGRQLLVQIAATLGLGMQMMAQTAHIDIDASVVGNPISPILYGIFFEEINHAGDGGLYAELVRNRSFEDADTPQAWKLLGDGAKMAIDTANPLNPRNPRSLRWEVMGSAALVNEGYWGIAVQRGKRYRFTMYARCDGQFRGALTVSLQSADGQVYAQRTLRGLRGCNGWAVSMAIRAPSPSTVHAWGVSASSNERLRTSSAYSPPSPAWLISSKKMPYRMGLIGVPAAEASISICAVCALIAIANPSAAATMVSSRAPLPFRIIVFALASACGR